MVVPNGGHWSHGGAREDSAVRSFVDFLFGG